MTTHDRTTNIAESVPVRVWRPDIAVLKNVVIYHLALLERLRGLVLARDAERELYRLEGEALQRVLRAINEAEKR